MPKNIIICCDGTGNEYGRLNTNVLHLYESLVQDDEQVAFYDPGIGTFSFLGLPVGERFGVLLGKAFGLGLRENLADAYAFLMQHYEPGDRVYLFGFSRGAFTVRALAGLLYKCGLLKNEQENLTRYAIELYNRRGNNDVARGFKVTFARPCPVYFIGVWDTVASLGWFLSKRFFDARLNPEVTHGYHAMAIDEQRRRFRVLPWDETLKTDHQRIEQVWFPGAHSDVGGGYADRRLSDVTLRWMLRKAIAAHLRVRRDWRRRIEAGCRVLSGIHRRPVGRLDKVPRASLQPDPLGKLHESRIKAWRLWRPAARRIPELSRIHASVFERMRELPDYTPLLPGRFDWVRGRDTPETHGESRSVAA